MKKRYDRVYSDERFFFLSLFFFLYIRIVEPRMISRFCTTEKKKNPRISLPKEVEFSCENSSKTYRFFRLLGATSHPGRGSKAMMGGGMELPSCFANVSIDLCCT